MELGAQSYSQFFRMDSRPAGGIAIYQLPGANALATAKAACGEMAETRPGTFRRGWSGRFRSTRRRS